MAIVTLRRSGVGAEALVTGKTLVALYGLFRLGQNLMPAVNDLLLGSLLYQSRLVPRVLPLLGIIGAPLLIANTVVFMFGITSGPIYVLTGIGVLPIALFEFSLGVWLTVKGFNQSANRNCQSLILVVGYLAILFGLIGRLAPLAGLSALLVVRFEFSLASGSLSRASTQTATNELLSKA